MAISAAPRRAKKWSEQDPVAAPRYLLVGTEGELRVFDAHLERAVSGLFDSPLVAAERADELERLAVAPEVADTVALDGWRGLAREIRSGLDLEVALLRLRDIGQLDSAAGRFLAEVMATLRERTDLLIKTVR